MSDMILPTGPMMPSNPLAALLPARPPTTRPSDAASAEEAAKGFESILIYRMIEEMKRTIPESGLLETGISGQVKDIFWYYLAQEMARQGGMGLWRQLQGRFAEPAGPAPAGAASEPTP